MSFLQVLGTGGGGTGERGTYS